MNNQEKIKKIKQFALFYKEEFGLEKDLFMTLSFKIAQLKDDEDNYKDYYNDLKEIQDKRVN